jgi:demethylsterigmatocystin 6-O-methyltransferase
MAVWAEGYTHIADIYPVEERLGGPEYDRETAMFVDVGGGAGAKSIALKKALPQLPGRFIVQDTSTVLANVNVKKRKQQRRGSTDNGNDDGDEDDNRYSGIELDVHDFFTEQPVKGARCYYLRQVLHVQPDDRAVEILRRLRDAMTPGYSKILIHEIITPEKGASAWVVAQDYNMMTLCGTAERSEEQWRKLCARAGLSIGEVFVNDHPSREGILEVVL